MSTQNAVSHDLSPSTRWRLALPIDRWHRPLLVLSGVLGVLAIFALLGWLIDDRQLLGVNIWEKPLKFSISAALYAVTWAWLIGQFTRMRRIAWWAGTVISGALAIELVIIVGLAAAGMTSHFNKTTAFNASAYSIMAAAITTLWVATLLAGIALWRNSGMEPARQAAIRWGVVISLLGMGLAFLMTSTTAAQHADFRGISGAHAVGVADGGPGLPFVGWSTIAGDLRVPHFLGIHALQALPVFGLLLEVSARRFTALRDALVRRGLVLAAGGAYLAVVGLTTMQALRGQSLVAPDGLTLSLGATVAGLLLAASLTVLVAGKRRQTNGYSGHDHTTDGVQA
ncbi:hypothetical protein BH11ACT4_BH11ACT4_06980 [soil metagenome]